jgi:hypothetical protein
VDLTTEGEVVIVTSSGLENREIVARLPAVAGDFSVLQKVQDGSAHSVSYPALSPGVKRSGPEDD